jgi:hypothetical protein
VGTPVRYLAENPSVVAGIKAPSTARAGRPFNFEVLLQSGNPKPIDFSFWPCPGYTQTLGDVEERLSLNCMKIDYFGSGPILRTQRFAMVIHIPRG